MLRCLTKSKVDCSFQNNEFRFKNRGFTQFFFGFLFFYHFFGLHWMKLIRNGMLKIMGFFLETRGKKRRKNTVHMEEKKLKKKKRPGRDSNPRSSVHHGNHHAALRDRRLTTWPPSRSLKLEEKLKALNLVPKMLTHIN